MLLKETFRVDDFVTMDEDSLPLSEQTVEAVVDLLRQLFFVTAEPSLLENLSLPVNMALLFVVLDRIPRRE